MLMDVEQPNIRLGSFIWIKKDLEVRSTHARTAHGLFGAFTSKELQKGWTMVNIESLLDPIRQHAWDVFESAWAKWSLVGFPCMAIDGHRWPILFLQVQASSFSWTQETDILILILPQIQKASKNHHPFLPNLELDHPYPSIHHSTIPRPTLIATLAASTQRSAWLMVSGTYLSLMGFSRPTATSGSPALAPKVPSPVRAWKLGTYLWCKDIKG